MKVQAAIENGGCQEPRRGGPWMSMIETTITAVPMNMNTPGFSRKNSMERAIPKTGMRNLNPVAVTTPTASIALLKIR